VPDTDTAGGITAFKLASWVDKILLRAQELIKSSAPAGDLNREYFKLSHEDIEPVLNILAADPAHEQAAQLIKQLRDGLEALFLAPPGAPEARKETKSAVFRAATELRNLLNPATPREPAAPQTRLRDLPWRTFMNEEGHIIFDAGGGLVVPIRGELRELAKGTIIAQAIRQQPVYPESVRPPNVRQQPGALIKIEDAKRLIVLGDLHGRYDNLELVLADKDNWNAIKQGEAHLLFLGDAVHPSTSEGDQDAANYDSFRVLFLILSLRAENPGNVHYLMGNHENSHAGGVGAGKGETDVEEAFTSFIREHFGQAVLDTYEAFLRDSPYAARIRIGRGGHLLAVHASPSILVKNEQGLINLAAQGRLGKALTEIVWNRNFDPRTLFPALRAVECQYAICGHTRPTAKAAAKYGFTCMHEPAFGHVHGKQMIVCSQNNTFGYLDIDLSYLPPQTIEDLRAPDGKYAFRVLKRG